MEKDKNVDKDVSKLPSYGELIDRIKENKSGVRAFNSRAAKRLLDMSRQEAEQIGKAPISESYARVRITRALKGNVDWMALEAMEKEIEPVLKMRIRISKNMAPEIRYQKVD